MSMHVGIVGGGIGGLAAAIGLRAQGIAVTVFEQAPEFGRVGADINLTPNAVRALDGLGGGVGAAIRETAARPTYRISRTWDSGEETSRLEMGDVAERKYDAPQLTIHRADLLSALEHELPSEVIRLGHRLTGLEQDADGPVRLGFDGGASAEVDVVIGADGIHSSVRSALFGKESPEFTGVVAFRAVVPSDRLDVPNLDAFTKWWGPDPETQIVTFPLNRGRDTFIFATTPQESWTEESWTTPGDVVELRAMYEHFHPEARALLDRGLATERDFAEVAARSRRDALGNPYAQMQGDHEVDDLLAEPYVRDPLRRHDLRHASPTPQQSDRVPHRSTIASGRYERHPGHP